jgi:hypothetical protein
MYSWKLAYRKLYDSVTGRNIQDECLLRDRAKLKFVASVEQLISVSVINPENELN